MCAQLEANEEPLQTEKQAAAKRAQWKFRHGIRRNNQYGEWLEGWGVGVKVDGSLWWKHSVSLVGEMNGLKAITDDWVADGTVEVPQWARNPLLDFADYYRPCRL